MSGAPAKPMSGVLVAETIILIASATKGAISSRSGSTRAATSAGVVTGAATTGPGVKSTATPIGGSGVMMSEKRIAASTGKRRSGCRVTSAASSGVRTICQKPYRSLMFRYSGR